MDILNEELTRYAEDHTVPESATLAALNRETYAKVLMPRMLSGHLQGQALRMFSMMIRPARILEIGTYTGYSALCLAEGLRDHGMLHTIDINDELRVMVERYVKEAGMDKKITLHSGDARQIIPALNEKFDLVFIDADKVNYANYFDLVFPMVPVGGFLIADNVLWSGKVLERKEAMDNDTRAIDAFNQKVHQDPRVMNVLFPIRDGLMVMKKISA
jgi:predicted O-methyltransferase YrrM